MNREIKFRGKSIKTGEWIYGFLFELSCDGYPVLCIGTEPLSANDYSEIYKSCYEEVIPETVGEYIGIKDNSKKEVKIYTDDIVQASYNMFDYVILKVIFDEETLMYSFEDFEGNKECCDCFDEIIVKGNIYENLELLEG